MANLLEYVGSVHIFLGPYRGNPIALYLRRTETGCLIGPKVYPWNDVVGAGETPNKAAADFEDKWKGKGLAADMYSGPSWEGGIKPEKPAPPKPTPAPKSATAAAPASGNPPAATGSSQTVAASKPAAPAAPSTASSSATHAPPVKPTSESAPPAVAAPAKSGSSPPGKPSS